MRAIDYEKPGSPEVLRIVEVDEPSILENEVLIDVSTAGVNFADLRQRVGAYALKPEVNQRMGLECAGTIVAVGTAATPWQPGDAVCALLPGGGYAERVAVDSSLVLPLPKNVGLLTAGGLPEMAATVWSNLMEIGRLQAGQSVLIHGGAGGIGAGAIQIAHSLGAQVLATCGSEEKMRVCEELGADTVINYRTTDFVDVIHDVTDGVGVNLILDNMGAAYLSRNIAASAEDGKIVTIGLQGGKIAEIDLGQMMSKRMSLHVTSLRDRPLVDRTRIVRGVLEQIWPLIECGAVRLLIDSSFDLSEVTQAHARLESGDHVGKVLLTVSSEPEQLGTSKHRQ
ncbi:NAD(P)H-quinone oxidoreductase [Pseudarthrobacter sp. AG30]|uniref:NAD(P)H-quinone oxidoreductase n=1 Tax=Pseudarthrobacter sp. AG30 TaxID=2249742 RepID=UPI000D6E2392|nr:NAD(P)H-quinone oxidoreductase [Pseudarthrobacter sp. AG30]RAX14924.1 NAD(P)H-quinone oxidoreductase [Pseudarthrobacter sp. AG30]